MVYTHMCISLVLCIREVKVLSKGIINTKVYRTEALKTSVISAKLFLRKFPNSNVTLESIFFC